MKVDLVIRNTFNLRIMQLTPGHADKLVYILYPLFFHEFFYSLHDIKESTRVGEAGGAYLDSTGSSHNELYGIAGGSDATAADDR